MMRRRRRRVAVPPSPPTVQVPLFGVDGEFVGHVAADVSPATVEIPVVCDDGTRMRSRRFVIQYREITPPGAADVVRRVFDWQVDR